MSPHKDKKSLIVILSVFSLIIFGTYFITLLARGYRPHISQTGISLKSSGLLSATSKPKGAGVYLDDKLITATDDTINLPPGQYFLKIVKDGYFSWQKNINIKKETVFQSDAQLFRSSPDLRPITQTGAINPTVSPDYSRVIYSVASASAVTDNGLYLIELASSPLALTKNTPRQISPNYPSIDWSTATFTFSPDSRQVLASFTTSGANYLLNLDSPINFSSLVDVTYKLALIKDDWKIKEKDLIDAKIAQLPPSIQPAVSTESTRHISISTADDKILYLSASDSAIPDKILSPPPAQSTQPQARQVKSGNYYVYDVKDDTNFLVGPKSSVQNPFWLYGSNNIVYVENGSIIGIDYDATNKLTIFNGQVETNNVFPWADGTKIIVLTSAYSGLTQNLYAITIR